MKTFLINENLQYFFIFIGYASCSLIIQIWILTHHFPHPPSLTHHTLCSPTLPITQKNPPTLLPHETLCPKMLHTHNTLCPPSLSLKIVPTHPPYHSKSPHRLSLTQETLCPPHSPSHTTFYAYPRSTHTTLLSQ